MPNWCSNSLTVEGERASEWLDTFVRDGEVKDLFSIERPRPAALADICTGSVLIDGVRYELWRETPDPDDPTDWAKVTRTPVTPTEQARLRLRFGSADPIRWSRENWGTKWDTDATRVSENRLSFETAWSPPVPWVTYVSERHPNLTFTLAYSESGSGFYGVEELRAGDLVSRQQGEGFYVSDVDWDLVEDPWDALTPAVRNFLEEYDLGLGG